MKKLIFLIILNTTFLIPNSSSFAQNKNIDSLLTLLKTDKADTNKVNRLNKLSLEYRNIGIYETASEYSNAALILAQQLNFKKGFAASYNNIGYVYYNQGNYPDALKNHFASLKIREAIGDKQGIAASYNNIGNVYYSQGNYPDALKNHFASLKIRETIGDKQGIAASYNNIGNVYYSEGNYPDALKNYFASLKIWEAIGDKQGIAGSYNNIGYVYSRQGNYPDALKKYFASLQLQEAIGNKQDIANSYNNIGNVYQLQAELERSPALRGSKLNDALKNHFASLQLREVLGDKQGIAESYINIGAVYTKQKKYKEAEEYLIKGKKVSKKIGFKECIKDSYSGLAEADSAMGNWKAAYENHKLSILYKDSIDNEQTKKKTIQSVMQYEFDKKEIAAQAEQDKKDAVSASEAKREKVIRYSVIAGLILMFIVSFIIFRSLRITRKQKNIIEVQKNEVQQQKQIVEKQKHLVEEHQKEIIDSITYAKRLQKAILPRRSEILKNLPESFVLYKPKDIVAGDFYWMEVKEVENWRIGEMEKVENEALNSPTLQLSNSKIIFIAAADCTGHGVPGAMVSMVCSNALNRTVNEFGITETGKILDNVRELVVEAFKKSGEEIKDGMDISLCRLELPSLVERGQGVRLQWSGANNSLLYFHDNELQEIKADKQPIGKYDYAKPFTTHNLELNSAFSFYLFTDGYADQIGGISPSLEGRAGERSGKKLMKKTFKEELLKIQHQPMAAQKEHLSQFFENWKGNTEQVDDVCVIGVRI